MKQYNFYVISTDDLNIDHTEMTDQEFKDFAIRNGGEYTPAEFLSAFNTEQINTFTDVARLIDTDEYHPSADMAIRTVDRSIEEIETLTNEGKDKSYIIGWAKQSLKSVKNIITNS